MKNKLLIILVIFTLLFLPYVRRVYLINLYPDGVPYVGTKMVFFIVMILIMLFQLKNIYYPPKVSIFQRLMDYYPTFAEIVIFLYKGLQTTYYKPLKDLNTYLLKFNVYKSIRGYVATVYRMNRQFKFKIFKVSQFISYIFISVMSTVILIIFVVYPYVMLDTYSIKGMCLFSTYSMCTTLANIWYNQVNEEQINQRKKELSLGTIVLEKTKELLTTVRIKLNTLHELETLLTETKDDILLENYALKSNHVRAEVIDLLDQIDKLEIQIKTIHQKDAK
jgi:hypothetical protein